MKYAVKIYNGFYHFNQIDEIIVPFKVTDDGLPHFIQEHSDKRVWLDCSTIDDEKAAKHVLQALKDQYQFGVIVNTSYNTLHFVLFLKSANIPLLFTNVANDWDKLHYLVDVGAAAIYVGEALGFEIDKVAEFLHSRNIEVWVHPNIAQSSIYLSNPFTKFWIRPEDVSIYEPYVDVMQMWHLKDKPNQQDTYIKVYQRGKFAGPLDQFLIDFNAPGFLVYNAIIPQEIVKRRISCGKACLKGATCSACGAIERITKKAAEVAEQINERKEEKS